MTRALLGVDVGGTFTDLVGVADGRIVTAKVPSTPADQSAGVVKSIRASGLSPAEISTFRHGTTVATNALLERRGARIGLVTTEGFRDLIEIGRQNRPSLYDLTQARPPPLVPRELRFTVRERMGPEGELAPLDEGSLHDAARGLEAADVEAVAVCLLFAFLHPAHERRAGEILREELPHVHVSLSSDLLPELREYERFATTVAGAYLGPRLAVYLRKLADAVAELGLPEPLVMQSSGGVTTLPEAAEQAARVVVSGPAGGAVGAAHVAEKCGYPDALAFDMGGTSTDVALVVAGEVATTTETVVAGVPIRFPAVDVHSVSAGGGSVAWVDEGGALRVGPRSAGADPGPAAYGQGGAEATVTDANLCLGYLADGATLGGEVVLRRELSERALARIGARLGLEPGEAADGIVRVANAEMVRALRVMTVERGLDPREFALVAFGGAGPMHACALAEELDIATVLVPKASGVLSALGLAISDLRRDDVRPLLAPLQDLEASVLEEPFRELERAACEALASPGLERRADLRYRGQAFELTVAADDAAALEARFHAAHERRYGYRMEDEAVELVSLRLTATVPAEPPSLAEPPAQGDPARGLRRAAFDGEWTDAQVLDRPGMGAGSEVNGPAIVAFPEATCVVRPGWRGAVDATGTLVLERRRPQ